MKQTVADIGEFGLIERIRDIIGYAQGDVSVGLGDDAATFLPSGKPVVVTTDAMVEDIHFRLNWTTAEQLAHKALASTLSDLAAKAAMPLHAVISIGAPGHVEVEWMEAFYRSLASLANQWNTQIIGGDTVSAEKLWLSLTAWGEQTTPDPIRIDQANSGDMILVTGTLGDAAGGLQLLMKEANTGSEEHHYLIQRFSCPTPRLEEAIKLVQTVTPTTMTDLSDGISRDLRKVCGASRKGAEINAEYLPVSNALKQVYGEKAPAIAWQGGEDYELLLTLPPEDVETVLREWDQSLCPLSIIGEITPNDQGVVVQGLEDFETEGFDHYN